jgi:hypothetical protein
LGQWAGKSFVSSSTAGVVALVIWFFSVGQFGKTTILTDSRSQQKSSVK